MSEMEELQIGAGSEPIDWDHVAEIAATVEAPTNEAIASLSNLAQQQLDLEREIEEAKAALEEKQASLKHLTAVVIPAAMEALKVRSLELTDGSKFEVEEKIYASISEERSEEALQWLRDNGFGGLIKNILSLSFDTDEDERAAQIRALLTEAKAAFEVKQGVHAGTLKAWAAEQLLEKKNTELPEKLFGIFRQRVSTITAPKQRKKRGKAK